MEVVAPGTRYKVRTANGQDVELVFCHTSEGGFIDGITSEELLKVLVHRHRGFAMKVETTENINVWTHLQQAQTWLSQRTIVKFRRKNFKKKKQDGSKGNVV